MKDAPFPGFTGWAFTDAMRQMDCPRCGSKAGEDCRTPKGRRAWPPHTEREGALFLRFGTDPWTHKLLTAADVMAQMDAAERGGAPREEEQP